MKLDLKSINAALIGAGTVGGGVYRLLEENGAFIAQRKGIDMKITRVLVKDASKPRPGMDPSRITNDINDIVNDDSITVVAEAMGGTHPALEYALAVLKKGKTYVTANKELVAKHWTELSQAAHENGAGLYFEASVAGGVPVIKALNDSLQANRIRSIQGIINGTTNYILSKMEQEGLEYADVLRQAQELGYAEPDPTNDVEGFDAVFKLAILCGLSFGKKVSVDDIYREGISKIDRQDVEIGKELGYAIKLLAIGKQVNGEIEAHVHPTMVPLEHPLASVGGPFNAVFIDGSAVGELMLYGRGAGDMPTASAVVSDMVNAATQSEHTRYAFVRDGSEPAKLNGNWESAYYIRTMVEDKPGILAKISGVFGQHNCSIRTVIQRGREEKAMLIFVTHLAREKEIMAAVDQIRNLPGCSVESIVRVEE